MLALQPVLVQPSTFTPSVWLTGPVAVVPPYVIAMFEAHDQVFVVEQNRDAQLKTLLVNEAKVNPSRLLSVLHYDGTPITARFIVDQISQTAAARNVVPLKKVVS